MSEKFLDYAQFRDSFLIDWREIIINPPDSLWERVLLLFDACFELPEHELQKRLIVATMLTPSAIATNLPITFFWGTSGSGKSKCSTLAARLYGVSSLLESATTASIRNTLDERKYIVHPDDPDTRLEKNTILTWDDIRPVRISPNSPDSIFGLLKSGCSRATSKTRIALPGGKIQEFCTFGIKIISSIHPHWSLPGCEELKRRAMIFKFEFSRTDREYIDPELLDLSEIEADLKLFWKSDLCREYQAIKRSLSKLRIASSELREFKTMALDVLTTLAFFEELTPKQVVDNYLNPYQVLIRLPNIDKSITVEILEAFIHEKKIQLLRSNEDFTRDGMDAFVDDLLSIHSQEIASFLRERSSDGSLELSRIDNPTIHQLMMQLGFKPQSNKSGLIWVKPL